MGCTSGASAGRGGAGTAGNTYTDETDFRDFQKANWDDMKALHKEGGMSAVRQAYYETRTNSERKAAKEITEEEAVDIVSNSIPSNISSGWFRNADSDYKPKLAQAIMENPGTLNAGWNIAYQNYAQSLPSGQKPMSFEKWANTPQTMYRGDRGQKTVKSDVFSSFTPNRSIAEKFGDNITTIKIKPIDTWGSYQTTGEQEYLIPIKKIKK